MLWEHLLPHVHINSFATVLVQSLNQQVEVLIHDRFLISQRLLRESVGEVSPETLSGWSARLRECLLTSFAGAPHHQAPVSCY